MVLTWLAFTASWACAALPLKVGIYDNAPLVYTDGDNRPRGIFADILSHIARVENWEITYVPGSFEAGMSRLKTGQVDLLCAVAHSREREKEVRFSRENVLTNWGQVYAPMDSGIRDLTDLDGCTIALLKKDIHNQSFREITEKFNVRCNFVETENYHDVMAAVSEGNAQAGVVNRLFGQQHCSDYGLDKSGVIFNPIRLHFAFRQGLSPDIARALDTRLAEMKQDQASPYFHTLNRWLGAPQPRDGVSTLFIYAAGGGLALIFLLFFGNLLLRRKIRQKTHDLSLALETRKAAETRLRITLLSIGDGVIATDDQGCITLMNQVAQDLTGWPQDQAIGLKVATVFHTVDAATGSILPPPVQKVLETGHSAELTQDTLLISRDSSEYHVRDSAAPIHDSDGRIRGVVMVFRDVSTSARLQASIAKNEAYLKSVFRAVPAGIGVVSDRKITHVNQGVLEITGYSENELIGQSARLLYPDEMEFNFVGTEKYRQIAEQETGTVETRWRRKDGRICHVLLSSTLMDSRDLSKGVTFCVLDITQRKEAELRLKKSEAQYRALFEKTNDAIFLITPETGHLVDANTAALELTGLSLDELKQTAIQDIADPHGTTKVLPALRGAGPTLGEFRFKRPDSSQRIARMNIVSLSEQIVIAIAKDVTQDLHMETQLRQAQKMESIGTLAGGIAHDFNNILFPVLGFTEMLLEDVDEESPMRHGLNQIYASAMRAKELVGQILAFSRQSRSEPMPIKIHPIIKEALKLLRATIPATIEIRDAISRDCGVVKADPTQIHQVLINLTTNAYHAMEATGGCLTITLEKKKITASTPVHPNLPVGDYACLSVADTGPGIPPEIKENIFDPFFTTKEKGKGTGMGLSVVHGIVAGMKGGIKVDSTPGQGAVFHLYFPLVKEAQTRNQNSLTGSLPRGTEQVLLVDDEAEIIAMEKQLLERLGYQVTAETSSAEALTRFSNDPQQFDLVISDVAMPGMAGDRLAKALMSIRPDIPILLCTGFSDLITAEKAASIGAKGFILKPMVIKDLSNTIRRILDETKE